MGILNEETLQRALKELPGWGRDGKGLSRTFHFPEYRDGMHFANRVAELAEEQNHHPDMHVGYATVKVITWSHDLDGITERDIRLARAVSELA